MELTRRGRCLLETPGLLSVSDSSVLSLPPGCARLRQTVPPEQLSELHGLCATVCSLITDVLCTLGMCDVKSYVFSLCSSVCRLYKDLLCSFKSKVAHVSVDHERMTAYMSTLCNSVVTRFFP